MKKSCLIAIIIAAFAFALPALAQAPRQEQLLNGLRLLMWSDSKSSNVTVRIRIHAGSAFDPQGKEGVMMMLAENLFPNEASREFFAEDLGGGLKIDTTYDYIQITASSAAETEKFLQMIETLASAVANPTIDKEITAKIKAVQLAKLKTSEADPAYVADRAVAKRLLGTFPYGRPQLGTEDSLKKIDFADLIEARQRFLTADNATITVSGNFESGYAFKAIRRYFGAWLKSDKRVPTSFRQPDGPPAGLETIVSPSAEKAAMRSAVRGAARGGKDLAASEVFARIMEARIKARIPAAYLSGVFVRNESHVQPGIIVFGVNTGRGDIGSGNGKIQPGGMTSQALSDAITDAEFNTARAAAASDWMKRDMESFWLDADTYKIASVSTDRTAFDKVTVADVRAFSERLQENRIATVLVQ